MAEGTGRLGVVAIAGAALAAGAAAGWLGGRATFEVPPPAEYRNPLRDVVKGETLVHLRPSDRAQVTYRVVQVEPQSVLLSVEYGAPGSAPTTREIRVARACFGPLVILEGDVSKDYLDNSVRSFLLQAATPETVAVDALGRSFRCWKFVGESKDHGVLTYWVSDEVPVHGVVRVTSVKGVQWEIRGLGNPK